MTKGRPRKTNKNVKFSCTLTPAQLAWLIAKADALGVDRSEVLRMAVDKMMEESNYGYKNLLS